VLGVRAEFLFLLACYGFLLTWTLFRLLLPAARALRELMEATRRE